MPEDKMVEVLSGIVAAFVGPAATAVAVRRALRDLVDDDFFWEAATHADALATADAKRGLDG